MKRKNKIHFVLPVSLFTVFILYTAALMFIDVRPIGPQNSPVGFGAFNKGLHDLLGVNMWLYEITDKLSLAAIGIVMGFAILGLVQFVKKRSLLGVDPGILLLGGFYILVFLCYLLFEFYIVNYRPVLINGALEPSYPSSTTMLVMCIMPSAILQFRSRIQNSVIRITINTLCGSFTLFMVLGRVLSGVHWPTDILGGILLSAALVSLYRSVNHLIEIKGSHKTKKYNHFERKNNG